MDIWLESFEFILKILFLINQVNFISADYRNLEIGW